MTDRHDQGLKVRREALGEDCVDRSVGKVSDFMPSLRRFVTETCRNDIPTRPRLARRDRSIINLAMPTALNRPSELRLHVRGAINNGLSKEEVGEVLLQTTIPRGHPAPIESFKVAEEVLEQLQAEGTSA